MPFDLSTFTGRPSLWGEVRWPVGLGKALLGGPENGLDIIYHAYFWESIGTQVELRCLKENASTANEHVVTFFGPHFVRAGAFLSFVEVSFAPGVPWEQPPRRQPFRTIDPLRNPVPEAGGEVGTFRIHAPYIGVEA